MGGFKELVEMIHQTLRGYVNNGVEGVGYAVLPLQKASLL